MSYTTIGAAWPELLLAGRAGPARLLSDSPLAERIG